MRILAATGVPELKAPRVVLVRPRPVSLQAQPVTALYTQRVQQVRWSARYLPRQALDLTLSPQGWFSSGSLFLGRNCPLLGITKIVHGGCGKKKSS